jgi:hypothetical protein
METVAEIAPICGQPGLLAFLCTTCGGSRSDLISPELWHMTTAPTRTDLGAHIYSLDSPPDAFRGGAPRG